MRKNLQIYTQERVTSQHRNITYQTENEF